MSLSASAVVALWIVLLALGANLLLSASLSRQADAVLQARAEATAATVQVSLTGTVTVLDIRDDRILDAGAWIFDGAGDIVEKPPGSSPQLDAAAARLSQGDGATLDLGGRAPVRLLSSWVVDGGRPVAVMVTSASLSPYRQVERLALFGSIGVAVLRILIVHVVLRANVGRALRPVQEMTARAGLWSAEDVDRRFGAAPRPAELAELAGTLDQVLDRLSAVLRHEQRFSEELSYELRTPLARIQAEIDLLTSRSRSEEERGQAHTVIDESAELMRDILDTLMSAARHGKPIAVGRTELDPVLRRMAADATVRTGVAVWVSVEPDVFVGVEDAVVMRMLSPVLDNAVRYAGSQVWIETERVDGQVGVMVRDDGPGVDPEVAQRVFEPGYRGDPGDGHDGAGLGLALARRLVL
ncbi:MAG: sensor histidine kinase, partial [Geodermatophilaceae bacterium]|nr:sensor histidine kinase [Geodermatophilaceae bacterium]